MRKIVLGAALLVMAAFATTAQAGDQASTLHIVNHSHAARSWQLVPRDLPCDSGTFWAEGWIEPHQEVVRHLVNPLGPRRSDSMRFCVGMHAETILTLHPGTRLTVELVADRDGQNVHVLVHADLG